jgi:hypothetical protein
MYFVTVVNEGVGYSHVAYTCLLLGFFISAKYSMPHFHHSEHITYCLLMLFSWGLFSKIIHCYTKWLDDSQSWRRKKKKKEEEEKKKRYP